MTNFVKSAANVYGHNSADAQRPEEVPSWSYFGHDVLDHNRTKLGRIKFLTNFGSAISGMHLVSENIEKSPEKPPLWKIFKLMS